MLQNERYEWNAARPNTDHIDRNATTASTTVTTVKDELNISETLQHSTDHQLSALDNQYVNFQNGYNAS